MLLRIRNELIEKQGGIAHALDLIGRWVSLQKIRPKDAYGFFRYTAPNVPWHSLVWDAAISPKHAFIMWLAVQRKLGTKDNLPFILDNGCFFVMKQNLSCICSSNVKWFVQFGVRF